VLLVACILVAALHARHCASEIVLLQDVGSLEANTKILKIDQFSNSLGLSGFPVEMDTSNATITFLMEKDFDCSTGMATGNATDRVDGADVVVADFECRHNDMCKVAPVWVRIQYVREKHHGAWYFTGIGIDTGYPPFPCMYLDGLVSTEDMYDLFLLNKTLQVSIWMDVSDGRELITSWYFKLYARGFLAFCCIVVLLISTKILMMRFRHSTVTSSHLMILIANICQGILLLFLHSTGCLHYLNDACGTEIQHFFWSELVGLTWFTDLVFVSMAKEVAYKVENYGSKPPKSYLPLIGALLAIFDSAHMLFNHFFPEIAEKLVAVAGAIYILCVISVFACVLLNYRKLIRLLYNGSLQKPGSTFSMSLRTLAARFDYYSRYTILSSVLALMSGIMIATSLIRTLPGYIAHIALLDIAKLLNMYAQSMVLWPIEVTTITPSVATRTIGSVSTSEKISYVS